MTDKINAYKKAKDALAQASRWAGKIGKTYYGGTSGKGEKGSIVNAAIAATIYYQEYDGATNYHNIPSGLCDALSEIFIEKHDELIAAALMRMHEKSVALAKAAADEHVVLMQEAGLA